MTFTDADRNSGFTIEHIMPKADEAADEDRRKIEEVLFDIFSKYEEPIRTMDEERLLR